MQAKPTFRNGAMNTPSSHNQPFLHLSVWPCSEVVQIAVDAEEYAVCIIKTKVNSHVACYVWPNFVTRFCCLHCCCTFSFHTPSATSGMSCYGEALHPGHEQKHSPGREVRDTPPLLSQCFPLDQSHPCRSQEAWTGSGSSPGKFWFGSSSWMKVMLCRSSWACWHDFRDAHHQAGWVRGRDNWRPCLSAYTGPGGTATGSSADLPPDCSHPGTGNPMQVRKPIKVPVPFIPIPGRRRSTN